jgi:hypothetical protein
METSLPAALVVGSVTASTPSMPSMVALSGKDQRAAFIPSLPSW